MSNVMRCQMLWNANVMKFQMSWNVKFYEIANVMKCQMSWNVKCHEMSNVKCHEIANVLNSQMSWNFKSKMLWNVKCHEMSRVMKCQMSWNVKCHEMQNVMKCKMSWNADADAGSMTPSRNTRRYTLRSVPSSPGRSFLSLSLYLSLFFDGQVMAPSRLAQVVVSWLWANEDQKNLWGPRGQPRCPQ